MAFADWSQRQFRVELSRHVPAATAVLILEHPSTKAVISGSRKNPISRYRDRLQTSLSAGRSSTARSNVSYLQALRRRVEA